MIHRFIDRPGVRVVVPYWPIMVDTNNSPEIHYFVYTIGNGLPPMRITTSVETKLSIQSAISDPRLSPDGLEIAYGYSQDPAFGANNQNIRVVQYDDSGARDDVVTDSVVPLSGIVSMQLDWSPDGAKIIWSPGLTSGTGTGSRGMVKQVNRDGTGMTTLFTAPANQQNVGRLAYSRSGDYIAFNVGPLGSQLTQLWVMEDDGSNPTQIFTSTHNNQGFWPAWQNGADVLGFFDLNNGGGSQEMYTVNPDGTGLTNIFTDATNHYSKQGRLAWLSDDSAMACLKRTNGTTILNATQWVLSLIDGAGGGATDSALASGTLGANTAFRPWVANTSYEVPRIFYEEAGPSGALIVSVLEDLSDYRVDFDPDDPSLTDGETTDGMDGNAA